VKKFAALLLFFATTGFCHDELAEQRHKITLQIQRAPNRAELYFQRAELYRADAHWKQAESDYKKAKKLAPDMAATDLGLGLLYLNTRRYNESKEALDRFISHKPDHAEARVARGQVLSKLGTRIAAIAEYSKALTLRPDPEIYIERSKLLVAENRVHEALKGLDEGIRRLGPIVTMELFAIDLEIQLKRYDQALRRVDRIADQSERKEAWLARKGEILVQASRKDQARAAYVSALKAIENLPQARKNNRYTLDLEQRIRQAIEQLKEIHVE
jgi:tetratricopeptide (TPR) repeat protein